MILSQPGLPVNTYHPPYFAGGLRILVDTIVFRLIVIRGGESTQGGAWIWQ